MLEEWVQALIPKVKNQTHTHSYTPDIHTHIIHTHIYTHIHTHIYTYIHTHTNIHTHKHTPVYYTNLLAHETIISLE